MVLQYTIFFALLIGGAFANFDYGFYEEQRNCTQQGKMCTNCTTVSLCILMPDGFEKEDLYTCESGQTCLESLGDCSSVPNPKCDANVVGFEFTCHQIGMFPDPFDCTKYHMCMEEKTPAGPPENRASKVNPKSNAYKCGVGFSYDPVSTLCRNKLVNETCVNFVPPCKSAGQSGNITANPSLYFICIKNQTANASFPHLFSCPNNQVYNGQRCEDQTSPLPVGPDGKCTAKGLFDDPITCKKFIECPDKNVNPIRRDCPTGYRFSYGQKKCVEMTCR